MSKNEIVAKVAAFAEAAIDTLGDANELLERVMPDYEAGQRKAASVADRLIELEVLDKANRDYYLNTKLSSYAGALEVVESLGQLLATAAHAKQAAANQEVPAGTIGKAAADESPVVVTSEREFFSNRRH